MEMHVKICCPPCFAGYDLYHSQLNKPALIWDVRSTQYQPPQVVAAFLAEQVQAKPLRLPHAVYVAISMMISYKLDSYAVQIF